MSSTYVPTAWMSALERYEIHAAECISPTTLRRRMGLLRKLACDVGGTPADVTGDEFERWAQRLTCSPNSAGNYVHAARAFYTWAIRAGVAMLSPVPPATTIGERSRVYALDARWADAIAGFERSEIAAHRAPTTLRRRLQQVRRFAATINVGPWHVEEDDYGAWLARQNVSESRRASMRDALRAFYRWAHRAGRIATDPTAELDRRAIRLGVPESWEPEIRAWRRWLIGAGSSASTVRSRLDKLEQLARAHRSAGPYALTPDDLFDYMAGHQWARETRRQARASIRAFYGWAVASAGYGNGGDSGMTPTNDSAQNGGGGGGSALFLDGVPMVIAGGGGGAGGAGWVSDGATSSAANGGNAGTNGETLVMSTSTITGGQSTGAGGVVSGTGSGESVSGNPTNNRNGANGAVRAGYSNSGVNTTVYGAGGGGGYTGGGSGAVLYLLVGGTFRMVGGSAGGGTSYVSPAVNNPVSTLGARPPASAERIPGAITITWICA